MRSDVVDANIIRARIHAAKFTTGVLDAGDVVITYEHPQLLAMTPAAESDITLPADDATKRGQFFIIQNAAAATHDILVKSAAAATLGTIAATESALVFLDPTGVWRVMVGAST